MKKQFAASIPRRMYWSTDVGGCARCPECEGRLQSEHHCYCVAVRGGRSMEMLLVGNNGGHFCSRCPLVVIDSDAFRDTIGGGASTVQRGEFAVLGIVDLSAVPEEKRGLPFDEQENPVPLVEFLDTDGPQS